MANLRVDKITSTETFETTGSVQFDGANDHLDVGSAGDFNYLHNGAASFTAEFWVYPQLVNSRQIIFSTGGNSDTTGFVIRIMSSGSGGSSNGYFVSAQTSKSSSGNYLYWDSDPTRLDANTWYHIAIVYDHTDNTLKIYVDGKLTNSGFSRTQGTFGSHSTSNSTHSLHIGEEPYDNSKDLKGHLSNLRILNGVKLYTSNFKPPMRELEVTPETTLLCCQSKTDATLEKTGKTIEANGNAVANELTPGILTPVPKAGAGSAITGSVEFSGGTTSNPGDYLSVLNTTDLRLGSSDFTVEAYVNFTNGAVSNGVIVALWDSTDNRRSWNFYFDRSNGLYFAGSTNGSSGNNNVNASIDIEDGEWYHVAACRSGSTIKLFVNGVERASNTSVGTYYENTVDPIRIGAQNNDDPANYWKGFISNLRIVKGTALYTDSFIPPTRELKRVPGTVLLCCQDPDNPLTEATGKTITGYGSLQRADGVELITNGSFSSTDNWTAVNGASLSTSSGQIVLTGDGSTAGGGATQGFTTVIGKKYVLKYEAFSGTISAGQIRIGTSSNSFNITFDNSVSASAHDDITFIATSTTTYVTLGLNAGLATSGTFKYDNVSVKLVDGSNKGSNFTPQVGDDRKVTLEGVTKINSDAYFYLPTGDTESRTLNVATQASSFARGINGGGYIAPNNTNTMQYITIATTGNGADFGDLTAIRNTPGAVASSTRGIWMGGTGPSPSNTALDVIDYVTIASTGNAADFGDLINNHRADSAAGNSTRGLRLGQQQSPAVGNTIEYITIASTGDAKDFGDLVQGRSQSGAFASPTRAVQFGGYGGPSVGNVNTIDYVTIQTMGNSIDFGDLKDGIRTGARGCSNATRGVFGGGYNPTPYASDLDYVTIASTGNSQDFGNLSMGNRYGSSCSSLTRGIFFIGESTSPTPGNRQNIDYVTIATTSNANDFGDLISSYSGYVAGACSSGHGGLG